MCADTPATAQATTANAANNLMACNTRSEREHKKLRLAQSSIAARNHATYSGASPKMTKHACMKNLLLMSCFGIYNLL
jgi:hypothetical protein